MVQHLREPVIVTDRHSRIVSVNAAFSDVYGYSEEHALGQEAGFVNAEPDADTIQERILAALTSGNSWESVLLQKRANGERFSVRTTIFSLSQESAEIPAPPFAAFASINQPLMTPRGSFVELMAALNVNSLATPREIEVLELLLLGRTAREIGEVLGISVRTVRFHSRNIMEKLGADSRHDLVRVLFDRARLPPGAFAA